MPDSLRAYTKNYKWMPFTLCFLAKPRRLRTFQSVYRTCELCIYSVCGYCWRSDYVRKCFAILRIVLRKCCECTFYVKPWTDCFRCCCLCPTACDSILESICRDRRSEWTNFKPIGTHLAANQYSIYPHTPNQFGWWIVEIHQFANGTRLRWRPFSTLTTTRQ